MRQPQSLCNKLKLILSAMLLGSVCSLMTSTVMAVEPDGKIGEARILTAPSSGELSPPSAKVDVNPVARDEEIRKRLQSVLDATDWFADPQVQVEEGVVFLNGQVKSDELRKWAAIWPATPRMLLLWPTGWMCRSHRSGISARL